MKVEVIMLFYILLTTAVTAMPKKSLVSISNDEIFFFPMFHLISGEAASSSHRLLQPKRDFFS